MCVHAQAFHALYHTDENVLLGAPTGSGKTISAELAMLRVFNHYPGQKVIYIAPLKVLQPVLPLVVYSVNSTRKTAVLSQLLVCQKACLEVVSSSLSRSFAILRRRSHKCCGGDRQAELLLGGMLLLASDRIVKAGQS